MADEHEVVPGTGWFEIGNLQAFGKKMLNGLVISLALAIFAGFTEFVTSQIQNAPVDEKTRAAILLICANIIGFLRRIVFPTDPVVVAKKD